MKHHTPNEQPVIFSCEDSELLGIIHSPGEASEYGLLTLVAGGPQYRGGCGRQLVSMARALSASGIPVMRFDHRGLGDSGGKFLGFQHVEKDLRAAIECFKTSDPRVKKVVLWGGCDAASAVMINAWKFSDVAGFIVGNPFVSSEETQSIVAKEHYRKRLMEWSFWRKILMFEFDYSNYVQSYFSRLRNLKKERDKKKVSGSEPGSSDSYIDRMLLGMRNFKGPVLFIMSGQSLVSKEFDALVAVSSDWNEAYSRHANARVDLPEADQTFSSQESRDSVNTSVRDWIFSIRNADGEIGDLKQSLGSAL